MRKKNKPKKQSRFDRILQKKKSALLAYNAERNHKHFMRLDGRAKGDEDLVYLVFKCRYCEHEYHTPEILFFSRSRPIKRSVRPPWRKCDREDMHDQHHYKLEMTIAGALDGQEYFCPGNIISTIRTFD